MKKSEIMAVLKTLGYGFVKWSTPTGTKVYTFSNGSKPKGIKSISRSPMDVTNAKNLKLIDERYDIIDALQGIGLGYVESHGTDVFIANAGAKNQIVFAMYNLAFQTYSRQMGLDPGYVTEYFMFDFEWQLPKNA